MRIIIGSRNAAKLAAVERAAHTYWPQAEIMATEAQSGVPHQPLTLEETVQGAVNRARAAFAAARADLAVGQEDGCIPLPFGNQYVLMGMVAVFDGTRTSVAPTAGVPLPAAWVDVLRQGKTLGEVMDGIVGKGQNNARPYLTNGVLTRADIFMQATQAALAPWATPNPFAA